MTKKRRKTQNYPLVGDFNLPNLTHPMAARGICLLWLPSHSLGGIISMTSDLPLYISPTNLMSYSFNCKNPWKIRSSGSSHHSTHSHRWPCHVHSVSAPNLLNSCFSPTWWERNGPKSRALHETRGGSNAPRNIYSGAGPVDQVFCVVK